MAFVCSFRGVAVGIVILFASLVASTASAQSAWVEDPKSLTASLQVQYVPSTFIVASEGMMFPAATPTTNIVSTLGAEYVPIENLQVDVDIPMAMVRYDGNPMTMAHDPAGKWDDGNFHTTLTDFSAHVRYQLLDEPYVALTPSVGVSIPMMDYETIGFATGGRHLKMGHVGLAVGRTLDPYVPNLYLMAGYEFSFGEKDKANAMTKTIGQNRSDVDAQIGYLLLDGKLGLAVAMNFRQQHDGINFVDFGPKMIPFELTSQHDAILKESWFFIGPNVTYSINDKLTVGAVARFFISGENTRDQSLYGVNLSYRAL